MILKFTGKKHVSVRVSTLKSGVTGFNHVMCIVLGQAQNGGLE